MSLGRSFISSEHGRLSVQREDIAKTEKYLHARRLIHLWPITQLTECASQSAEDGDRVNARGATSGEIARGERDHTHREGCEAEGEHV